MSADRLQQRVDELFVAAVERPADQRDEFLDQAACNDSAEVRQRVRALIAADERADANFAARSPLNLHDFSAEKIRDPRIGERIGPYVIQGRIASGGFGTVYHAVREVPYREDVAIKLLHRDSLAAPPVVQRVLREMQALSDLRHPHIVSQLQANMTSEGEPYIVMEFVRGRPLDQYCDEQQLSIDERLQLFQQICGAVEFAHQHGWLHRDLKPSNILVTDDGTPKLLDFGIAKLVEGELTTGDDTLTQDLIGTPQYMSPEQFGGQAAGPATDVYALGAILYELISGHRAFDVMCGGIDGIVLEAIQHAVKETVPHRPSTLVASNRLTTTGVSKEQLADQRRASPSSLKRCLSGDIDNIVMMAIRKEPTRRYASAAAVADDIQRWLEHRPVLARRDSLAYRTSKFVRRNRRALLIGMTIACCLTATFLALSKTRRTTINNDTEKSLRFVESAQRFVDDDDVARAVVRFHAAYQAAPSGSEMRSAAARMLAGWSRYLGVSLGTESNIRYAFHDRGQLLSVADAHGVISLWDTSELRRVKSFSASGPVSCHALSTDGGTLLAATRSGRICCWDAASGKLRCEQEVGNGVISARFQGNDAFVLQVSEQRVRCLQWEAAPGAAVDELASRALPGELIDADFVADQLLVVAWKSHGKRKVELWDAASLQVRATVVAAASALGPRRISIDERLIAQSYRQDLDERIAVVDLATLQQVVDMPGKAVDLSEGGASLLAKHNRKLALHELSTKSRLDYESDRPFAGRWDAAIAADSQIRVVEACSTPNLQTVVTQLSRQDRQAARSRRLAHPLFSRETHSYDRAEFDPTGRYVVFDNRHDDIAARSRVPWMWAVEPFRVTTAAHLLHPAPRCLSTDGDTVVVANQTELQAWEVSTGMVRKAAIPQVTSVQVGGTEGIVVAGDLNGKVYFLALPAMTVIKQTQLASRQAIRAISICRDENKMLVTTQQEVSLLTDLDLKQSNSVPAQVTLATRGESALDRAKLSDDGSTFALASHVDISIRAARKGAARGIPFDLTAVAGRVGDFVLVNETPKLATIDQGDVFLSIEGHAPLTVGNRRPAACVALRPDGNVLAIGDPISDVSLLNMLDIARPLCVREKSPWL